MATAATRLTRPSYRRSRSNRWIAGVAGGLAQHLGMDPLPVRIAFVLLTFAAGFGLVVYLLLWLLARLEPVEGLSPAPPRGLSRPTVRQATGYALLLFGIGLLLYWTGFWFGELSAWPVILAAVGFAVLWARGRDDGGRGRLAGTLDAAMSSPGSVVRFAIGSFLILGAMAVFLAANTSLRAVGNVVLAGFVFLGGAALLLGPWIWRMGTRPDGGAEQPRAQ